MGLSSQLGIVTGFTETLPTTLTTSSVFEISELHKLLSTSGKRP